MNLEKKILVVNDDTEDIIALQRRLPGLAITGASQFEVVMTPIDVLQGFNLIVVDNDANNLAEPKGAKTLAKLREAGINTPVVYTSFQPVMVPQSVVTTPDVKVVKTDDVAAVLAAGFGVPLAPLVTRAPGGTTVITTYNDVKNYPPGVYAGGKLIVISFDKQAKELAPAIVKEQLQSLFGTFSFRNDRSLLDNIIVYDGISGREQPGAAAASIGHDARMVVKVAACTCDWERKERLIGSTYVDVFPVQCGGGRDLGLIADTLLGVQRPDDAYDCTLLKPRSADLTAILAPAKRFAI